MAFPLRSMVSSAAVVLAAGKGTRMRSLTPKVLHRICGREMLGLVVDAAQAAGLRAVVVVPPDSQAMREVLGEGVIFVEQPEPLGSGHALFQAKVALEGADVVVVLYADVPLITPGTLTAMMRLHEDRGACITMLTARPERRDGLGRVVRNASGAVVAVVEESDAGEEVRAIPEINAGVYCFQTPWLWEALAGLTPSRSGELFLTDLVSLASNEGLHVEAYECPAPLEALGVNTRVQLAEAESALLGRLRDRWMLQGVTMPDPATVYLDATVELGQDSTVFPNTHIRGKTRVGALCEVGPNTIISDSSVGDRCRIVASVVEGSTLAERVQVGPFSHIRPGSRLEDGVYVGNFAEVKMSRLGPGTKAHHFSYLGDADIGSKVNIGAGTVTCNYDGVTKHRTVVGDEAFIGSDSMLVAPVTIGARSMTGAGSVVTRDVPPDSRAIGVPARVQPKKKKDRTRPGP